MSREPPTPGPQDPRPSVASLLADPSVRGSVKSVLRSWAGRDPVDAAEDAGLLALALERRADESCGLGLGLPPASHGALTDQPGG